MDQRKKINELLNKLLAQNEEYLSDKSFLYKIEKDIFLAQVRELYELLAQIPVHHQLEVGNEQELFSPSPSESLFDSPSPSPEEPPTPHQLENLEEEIPAQEPSSEELSAEVSDLEEVPKNDNPVSKLEKLLAELRGWGQAPEAAISPIPDVEEPLAPSVENSESPVAPPMEPEEKQEVTFDLGLTPPAPEDRPSYFSLERKVQEDEWGNEESETTKPRVAIMNPFVGGRSETPMPETPESSTSEESIETEVPESSTEMETLPSSSPKADETAYISEFSIVETLQLSSNATLKNQLHLKPIDSLKTGIGLNEKFLYIRELFGNDHINFANTIAQLNDFTQMQQAENLLHQQFIQSGKWDLQNPHVQTFLQLIYRRFS